MKRYILYIFALIFSASSLSSCKSGDTGELRGAYNKKFKNNAVPYGMVYIPQGKTLIGLNDEDITFSQSSPGKMTSFSAFYMDQTEISNAEYRQFVNWVRDSIAVKQVLGEATAPTLFKNPANAGATVSGPKNIDWDKINRSRSAVIWGKGGKNQSQYAAQLEPMYYSGADVVNGLKEIDVRKLRYSYSYKNIDLEIAGRNDPTKSRSDFIESYIDSPDPNKSNEHPSVRVYPDTAVWRADYSYTQNDPLVKAYFNHPGYDNYPVVGVNWEQANAFCNWRTNLYTPVAAKRGLPLNSRLEYRLPTDQEFEYAARGGRSQAKYPWGGPYIRNTKACLMANFKVGRGNYADDGGMFTVDVKSYFPNDYGLYNMAGNVSEWTATAYNQSAAPLLLDFNPNFTYNAKATDSKYLKRKVVRGGSWKDIGFFLQNSVGTYEYQDQPRSYIGFRCVSSYPGTNMEN